MPVFNIVITWRTPSFTAPMTHATFVLAPVAVAKNRFEPFVLGLDVGAILAAVGARLLALLGELARAANLVTGFNVRAGAARAEIGVPVDADFLVQVLLATDHSSSSVVVEAFFAFQPTQ